MAPSKTTTRLAQGLEVVGGGRIEPAQELGRGGHSPPQPTGAPRCGPTGPVASGLVKPRIYTKTGDEGTTGLLYGGRVPKDSWRIELNGTIDEAQSAIGLARAETAPGSEAQPAPDRVGPRPLCA